MSLRTLLVLGLIIGLAGWWFSESGGSTRAPAAAANRSLDCPLPVRVAAGEEPLQTDVPDGVRPFALQAATLTPLAGFSVHARVLSREDYRSGREAELSPTDLALGWKRMADDDVLGALDISQSSRWYHYRWSDQPPLAPSEIARSSANMHLIPGNDAVARTLSTIRRDDRVRIDGWLVEASASDGWRWRSSTSRTDSGGGACEVIYVCGISKF